jgi:hypothetical protein
MPCKVIAFTSRNITAEPDTDAGRAIATVTTSSSAAPTDAAAA